MKKKWKHIGAAAMACIMAASVLQPVASSVSAAEPAAGTNASESEVYEIYPEPQQMTYSGTKWVLRDNVNLIVEDGIDEATVDRLDEVLELKGLTATEGSKIESGATNILVGIYGSDSYVDKYVETNYTDVPASLFEKTDSYLLLSEKDKLVILGCDTDAAFYGLTSLYHIFAQMESNTIESFNMQDWADVVSRGFIEGYYGNPWSLEDRIDLMTWGGYYKLNSFFYAPKDDPKHNSNWRELYTEEELETLIKPLAEAGNASKCRFVFALHPYMYNAINYSSEESYQADLAILQAKFEQVIKVGVRQIAILADDAASVGGANYTKTLTDMSEWLKDMQKTYPDLKLTLPFCTVEYGGYGESYYANFPENVQIIMTGGRVWGEVTDSFTSTFTSNVGRGPYMWINWPCTDNSKKHLIMGGYTTFLHPGVDPSMIQGIVLNPMQQSEPSKVAIFGNACYSWNIWDTEEEADKAWDASFKYVDHNSAIETKSSDALKEISKHMINQAMDSRVTALQESVEISGLLSSFKSKLQAGSVTAEECNELIAIFKELKDAAKTFKDNPGNERLRDQIIYWLNCWEDTTTAAISYLEAVNACLSGNSGTMLQKYNEGKAAFAQSKTYGFHYVDHTEYAEVGVQHIVPLITTLEEYVGGIVKTELDPNAVLKTFITSRTDTPEGSKDNIFDGNDSTSAIFKTPNKAYAGDYVGVMFSKVQKIDYIRFLLGAGKDHFDNAKVQYTVDGTEWVDLNDTVYQGVTNQNQEVELNAEDLPENFEAKGVRLIATTDNALDMWLQVCEITVNKAGNTEAEEAGQITGTVTYDGMSVRSGSDANYFDGNTSTEVMLAKAPYEGDDRDTIPADASITITFDGAKTLGTLRFVQGQSASRDVLQSAEVQYTTDGTTWKTAGTLNSSLDQTVDFGCIENVTAVRILNKQTVAVWARIGEIDIREYVEKPESDGSYVYTNITTDILADTTEDTVALTSGSVTLGSGDYIGIKLNNIKEIEAISTGTLPQGLELQMSQNAVVWTAYDPKEAVDARYIRVVNTTNANVEWSFTEFKVEYFVIGDYAVESDFGVEDSSWDMRYTDTVKNVFDGELSTYAVITGTQQIGKSIIFDLGRQVDIDTFRYYIVETEYDYPRSVVFEVAATKDAENWTEVLRVENPEFNNVWDSTTAKDMQGISLTHDNSNPGYMYAEATGVNTTARYIRVRPTAAYGYRWLGFSEIMINGGGYVSMESDKDIISDAVEEPYQIPSNMLDGDFNTSYVSSAENSSFVYRLSEPVGVKSVRLIQVGNVSNAEVTATLWDETAEKTETVTLGTLNQTINEYVIPEEKLLFAVNVSWADVKPEISEIMTFKAGDDASAVKAEIQQELAKSVDSDAWTKDTKAAYDSAKAAAQDAVSNAYISKTSAENILKSLQAAAAAGVERYTSDALAAEVAAAVDNEDNAYSANTFRVYQGALTDAQAALAEADNLSKADGEAALAALQAAKANLTYSMVNNEKAQILVEDMSLLNEADYTPEAWEAVQAAKSALEKALSADTSDNRLNPAEYTQLLADAQAAVENKGTSVQPDKTKLQTAVADAEKLDEKDYTEDSWKIFDAALKAAKDVLNDAAAAADDVADALTALTAAQEALVLILPYEDVEEGRDWYYDYVYDVYQKGLMTGLKDTVFGPGENLARAQFAVILYRMEGEPEVTYTDKFPDVDKDIWYTNAILWAAENGIVTGYSDTGKFGPSDNITREQMAVMMYRYAKYKDLDVTETKSLSEFPDGDKVQPFAADGMKWCTAKEIISGKGEAPKILDPQGNTNRAECATIISRYVKIAQ